MRRLRLVGKKTPIPFLAVCMLLAFFSLNARVAHTSPEVHFADLSDSGLSIVPASCPSNPGDADAPWGCGGIYSLCPDGSVPPSGDTDSCPTTPPPPPPPGCNPAPPGSAD